MFDSGVLIFLPKCAVYGAILVVVCGINFYFLYDFRYFVCEWYLGQFVILI